ncbi:MAG: TIGR04283 family arsenosugar biosynthesis glycosyltransferase [Planctomycetota bacterium]
MFQGLTVAVVIPALDEEQAIGRVLAEIPSSADDVVVVDNGSTDATARVAAAAGARVVTQARRGYGSACLAGIAALRRPDVVVFLDADHSDHPDEMERLLVPIARGEADLVVGSRVLGGAARGSLTLPQRLGNALACALLRLLYRVAYTDLGPFRAIRRAALEDLALDDRDYGWTVQMQARAARRGLRATEVAVSYRPRIGRSKISGTLRGVVGAGTKILVTIARERWRRPKRPRSARAPGRERLVVFTREPVPGATKTRLIPLLGPEGAASLHRELLHGILDAARVLARRRGTEVEIRTTGTADGAPGRRGSFPRRDQGEGDLGARMRRAVLDALAEGRRRVVLVGSDCPGLTPGRLVEAFEALGESDVVLGPAADGGYTLIGVRADHPPLFGDLPWGEDGVLEGTRRAAAREGLLVHLLPTLPDIDRPEDVRAWARSRQPAPGARPAISVVIPTLDEEARLPAALASVLSEKGVEIVVADGGSRDGTVAVARAFGAEVVTTSPSRGRQLQAGAARARGGVLLFLHADTRLPRGWGRVVRQTLERPGTVAGTFTLSIDHAGWGLKLVEAGVLIRSRLFHRPYGDQAIFLRAGTLREAGGFPDLERMEDYILLERLRDRGRVAIAGASVRTSDRTWRAQGILGTTWKNQGILYRHWREGVHVRPLTGALSPR